MLRIIVVVLGGVLVTACAVVQSQILDEGVYARCAGGGGFYYLPKTHLQVDVVAYNRTDADKDKHSEEKWHQIELKRKRVADPERGYCLDYLGRITAEDKLEIKKYKEQPFLALVSSDAIDRSLEIADAIIKTIFIAASGNPDFKRTTTGRSIIADGDKVIELRADFDPFDPEQSAAINEALGASGFCLILETYTFDLGQSSINDYCDHPVDVQRRTQFSAFTYQYGDAIHQAKGDVARVHHAGHEPVDPTYLVNGLFYRPRITYQLYVFIKDNLQARGGWKLRSTHPVEMENIAPIMAIGVKRAAFTERKTTLVFDEGMLKEACHYKGSELLEAVQIPLIVVQSVVSIPANLIQVKIDNTEGMSQLMAAQDNAIKKQAGYLAELKDLDELAALGNGTKGNSTGVAKAVPYLTGEFTSDIRKQPRKVFAAESEWKKTCKTATVRVNNADVLQPVDTGNAILPDS